MYPCSDDFHAAVAANMPQKALFVFPDGVLTNEDFDVDAGIVLHDYFCTTEDLGIGEALSNELEFKLMNEKQLLNNFPFGEVNALLGVRILLDVNEIGFSLEYGGVYWTVEDGKLLKDGEETASQPEFTIASMAAMDGVIYCFSESGDAFALNMSTEAVVPVTLNAFMEEKVSRWAGYTFAYRNRLLTVIRVDQTSNGKEVYEFVPLGKFIVERPNVVDDIQINISCNDLMQKFDKDMNVNVTYPITLKNLLTAVCQSEGIPLATTSFINDSVSIAEAPQEFETCTKRDVIRWIAEAAGSNAKITRDGTLALVWLASTDQSFDEGNYVDCRPYYYQTGAVNKLKYRDMDKDEDTDIGSGSNAYLIQDNPFLK